MKLAEIFRTLNDARSNQGELFALLVLGVVESLSRGQIGPTEAVQIFFSAENCLFVRKDMRIKGADRLMSHGVQLPDLFDILPAEEAHRQFQHELERMRRLSLDLLDASQKKRLDRETRTSATSLR